MEEHGCPRVSARGSGVPLALGKTDPGPIKTKANTAHEDAAAWPAFQKEPRGDEASDPTAFAAKEGRPNGWTTSVGSEHARSWPHKVRLPHKKEMITIKYMDNGSIRASEGPPATFTSCPLMAGGVGGALHDSVEVEKEEPHMEAEDMLGLESHLGIASAGKDLIGPLGRMSAHQRGHLRIHLHLWHCKRRVIHMQPREFPSQKTLGKGFK